jgi:hypothetical protein
VQRVRNRRVFYAPARQKGAVGAHLDEQADLNQMRLTRSDKVSRKQIADIRGVGISTDSAVGDSI